MIIAILLWNMLSIQDCIYYQNIRYQKDRYKETIDFYLKDIGIMILCSFLIILFDLRNLNLVFDLCMLILFSSIYKRIRSIWNDFVITKRIIRLFIVFMIIDTLLILLLWILPYIVIQLFLLFMMIFHHFVFYFFVCLMHPIEMKIRNSYANKAKKKLATFKGIIIGITGSYGKTSIKNLVYDVLSMKYLCLKTRGSYNNQMGITKTILEEMNLQEVFICEMGADHVHEIEDLCKFVCPSIGILSAIGPQHLSTFKNIENILFEKMKLLESLPKEGMGFYNFDNFYLKQMEMKLDCPVTRVGIHSYADIKAINLVCDHLGSQFDVDLDGQRIHFKTSLLGEHNILNCLFAIALGHYLKVDIPLIQMAITLTKPTEHRMELKPFYKGMCIDNAYNSNPSTAKISLEVLKMMPGRHYLITPGFIDLGDLHDYYCEEFGKQMRFCDGIVLIGNCKAILKGLQDYDMSKVIQVNTMKEALLAMSLIIEEGDTLLIENDIPEGLVQ